MGHFPPPPRKPQGTTDTRTPCPDKPQNLLLLAQGSPSLQAVHARTHAQTHAREQESKLPRAAT